ncbi:UDP-N-acetylmuramoyl-tripeptide--D-alanyl-D-alanine ligase [Atopobium fossor]|uniref:UDP-N-acetylmuramoyl-tripeptide--D-alanyl-D- alanine ligase n=1 Tax=Atopobium fossor TaxID=39487 RepID=UPI0004102CF6|nr:UDP-N-acetylmuramoyl-tripeptide--D-alanyl-D-alanine ligase [Atopobium fossor]
MFTWDVASICAATEATLLTANSDRVVRGVAIDSREVTTDGLFVAFSGEHVDGNAYAPAAIQNGAGCVVLTSAPTDELLVLAAEKKCAIVRAAHDDGEEFMLRLAQAWREIHANWFVVGVTGSVGKTTTKDMLAAAISARYTTHATKGNFNNLIGLPLTLLSAPEDTQVIVAEMGMNHFGEITRLAAVAHPTLAVITNVGTSHIGLLGSRENIAKAKAEIVSGMVQDSLEGMQIKPCLYLVSSDDFSTYIDTQYAQPSGIVTSYIGTSIDDNLSARNIKLTDEGYVSCDVYYENGDIQQAQLPIPGKHLISDYLLALAVADKLNINHQASIEAIQNMPQTHMRLEIVGGKDKPRMIDDSYNASPSSMAAALDVLTSLPCKGKRVAVLGEMGEMGDMAVQLHNYVGAYAAAKPLDMLVLIGSEFVGGMREAAITMGMSDDKIETFETVDAAVGALKPILESNDLVLAKASRSSALDLFVKGVLA